MATINFEIELINELTGHTMDFEYTYETYGDDYTREEIDQLANDLISSRDPELYNEILSNISIVPSLDSVEYDDESD
jgi:uncharacterized membrane protein